MGYHSQETGYVELQFNYTDVAKLCHLDSTVLALFSLLVQMLPETSKICLHTESVLLQIRPCFSGKISSWSVASAYEKHKYLN